MGGGRKYIKAEEILAGVGMQVRLPHVKTSALPSYEGDGCATVSRFGDAFSGLVF